MSGYVHACALKVKRRATDCCQLELQVVVSCPTWVLESELGTPLEEQYISLTTEPHLQPPFLELSAVPWKIKVHLCICVLEWMWICLPRSWILHLQTSKLSMGILNQKPFSWEGDVAVLMMTSVCVCLCIWVLMCVHMCLGVCMCVCVREYIHICVCECAYVHMFLCALVNL